MANGAHALQLVEPAPNPSAGIERRIGEATADAVQAVSRGCYEHGWCNRDQITGR